MYKRHVAALLWVAAAWYLGNAVVIAVGAPEVLSLPAGIAVGLVVWLDPTGRLWGRRPATHAPTPGVDPG